MAKLTIAHYVLAGFVVAGFTALTGLLLYFKGDMPEYLQETFYLLVGAWISAFITVVQYWFGSSKGSADKNATIERIRNGGNQ